MNKRPPTTCLTWAVAVSRQDVHVGRTAKPEDPQRQLDPRVVGFDSIGNVAVGMGPISRAGQGTLAGDDRFPPPLVFRIGLGLGQRLDGQSPAKIAARCDGSGIDPEFTAVRANRFVDAGETCFIAEFGREGRIHTDQIGDVGRGCEALDRSHVERDAIAVDSSLVPTAVAAG